MVKNVPRQLKCKNTFNWGSTLKLEGCLTQPDKLYWKTKKTFSREK